MKKLSLVQGIQTAGLVLIALAVVGAISIGGYDPAEKSNRDVLSVTETSVMNFYVYYGEKTISELAPTEAGFPNIVKGGGAAVRLDLSPLPPEGTTVTFTTNESCVLFNDGAGGGVFGQSKTDIINAFYTIAIGAVDDTTYEGKHYCKLIASLASPSTDFNGQQQKLTFTVNDNDPIPEGYEEKKTTENIEKKTVQTTVDSSTKPQPPKAKLLDKAGAEIEKTEETLPAFKEKEPIYIKGTTIPNGEVKLYIFSEPQTATVTASDDGEWAYTIESIEPGEHRVEIEVTDPNTGETSDRQQVLAFQVAQAEQIIGPISTDQPLPAESSSSSSGLYIIAGVSVALLAVGIVSGIIWKKRHPHHEETSTFSPEDINNNIV